MLSCDAVIGISELHADPSRDGGVSTDAAEGNRSAAGTWCRDQGDVAFCADFSMASLIDGWTVEAAGNGGTGTLDPKLHTSDPFGFTATAQPNGDQIGQWCLRKDFTAVDTNVRLVFAARLDDLAAGDTTAALTLASLVFGEGQAMSYALELGVHSDGLHLTERLAGQAMEHLLKTPPQAATWTHFELHVDRKTSSANIGLTMDGGDALGAPQVPAGTISGAPTLRIGVVRAVGPNTNRVAHFDDVLVDLR
jgi:hypothetical protein